MGFNSGFKGLMHSGLEKNDGQVIFSERMTRSQKYVSYGAGQRWVLKADYDCKLCFTVQGWALTQIHSVSKATQNLGFTRTCIVKYYLSFTEYKIHLQVWNKKKTALQILIINF